MASLQTLPIELLEHIVGSFSLYCTDRPRCQCTPRCIDISPNWTCSTSQDIGSWNRDRKERILALHALCLTSRRLQNTATRHLYHHPDTKKWWLLARTLIDQPALAQHVKTLSFPENFDERPSKDSLPPQVLSDYQAQLARYFATATVLPDEGGSPQDHHERNTLHIWQTNGGNDTTALLASLCPAVERLEAVVNYGMGVDLFELCLPGSLPALRTAELAHWDTENGIPLGALVPLFKAARGLEVLGCHMLSDESDPGEMGMEVGMAAALRRVDLVNSCIGAGALGDLLKACPGLEMFGYEAGGACIGYKQFTPSQAKELMMEHGKRLKRVVMDLSMAEGCWDDHEDEWVGWDEQETVGVVGAFKERGVEFEITGI
jgi:hypothetical protein